MNILEIFSGTIMDGYFMSPRANALPEVLDAKFQFALNHMATQWEYHVIGLDQRFEVYKNCFV